MDFKRFPSFLDELSTLWTLKCFHPFWINRPLYGLNKVQYKKTYQSFLNIPRIIKSNVILKGEASKEYLKSIVVKMNHLDSKLENQRML